MHTIIIATIIISVVGLFILGLVTMHNRQTRKLVADLLSRFGEAAQNENLTISKKEILGNLIIGLDDLHNKLLMLKNTGNEYHSQVIDLNRVKECSKRKIYHKIDISMGNREKYENHVEQIALSFDIPPGLNQENIPFYDSGIHALRDLADAEQKSSDWAMAVQKIISQMDQKRA